MACEKLCKAYLIKGGTPPESLQSSHGYIANPLPIIIKQQILSQRKVLKGLDWLITHIRHWAYEIEVLNPAMKRDGQRPDNCEYPWALHDGRVMSPLGWSFEPSRLCTFPAGRTFLKLLREAIDAIRR